MIRCRNDRPRPEAFPRQVMILINDSWMGYSVPWHCHDCGKCGGRGDAGGRDACVAVRVFAAQAGAPGRYCQDPVRAAT